ncbi:hypothetical protein [Halorubrum sp. 2020YC2]|uniref:hypothetical protein n=1 Tax=Halorubrum sp. 2020YC2 TaxID=2836432 RepID=UPI001BEAA721|nr:hypothetical protein [Halorubrum sp. 2020YC2]QWC19311.1 hypothetical protein KI388_14620 [Halorubrum sp. 2020YC2]
MVDDGNNGEARGDTAGDEGTTETFASARACERPPAAARSTREGVGRSEATEGSPKDAPDEAGEA